MLVVFDLDFDAGSWPGPARRGASAGEAWLGPKGFLERLEVSLGLQGIFPAAADRALALIPRLEAHSGFWDASAAADPIGTAQRLLEWRDQLWESGWRGQKAGAARIDQLSTVAADIDGGFEDRLAAVARALMHRGVDIDLVELGTPRALLPKSWLKVLDGLAARRVRVGMSAFPPASPSGNLAAARRAGFAPASGDPSLQLVRPPGPMAAAELVAVFLRSLDDLGEAVLIGGDASLDAQLRRFALPTTGGDYTGNENGYAQLLRTVCELAWAPAHPARAHELLTHPDGPIPQGLARRLSRALQEWPSTTSEAFAQALAEGLKTFEDPARGEEIKTRVEAFLTPCGDGERVRPEDLAPRIKRLGQWLRAKASTTPVHGTDLLAAAQACEALLRLCKQAGLSQLSRPQLRQLLRLAAPPGARSLSYPAEAGLHVVGHPGGVAAPAERVIWWNFTEASYARPRALPLSQAERSSLKALGVEVPTAGELAQRAATRYKRPLWRATKNLILVCPHVGYDGEDVHPHPLWDEIVANLDDRNDRGKLELSEPVLAKPVARVQRELLPEPEPRRVWNLQPELIVPREHESSSSLETLLGCSLKWTLSYQAKLYPGLGQPVRIDARVYGSTAHELLARLASQGALAAPDAGEVAGKLFDEEAPRLATLLLLPGAHNERSQLRQTIADSAEHVASLVYEHGFSVVDAEKERTRSAGPFKLLGKLDLLLRAPDDRLVVIDFKWGGETYRRDSLKAGTAHQLAAYAFLTEEESPLPPATAFYILRHHRLMTDLVGVLPHAEEIAFASSQEVWAATVVGYEHAFAEMKSGRIVAGGVADDQTPEPRQEAELAEGRLSLPAACGFCDFKNLCGRRSQVTG